MTGMKGISKGKSGLVRQDASQMLMNCMVDSVITKTVFFIGVMYIWTEYIWHAVAAQDLIVRIACLAFLSFVTLFVLVCTGCCRSSSKQSICRNGGLVICCFRCDDFAVWRDRICARDGTHLLRWLQIILAESIFYAQTLSDMATQIRLLHTLRLLLMSTAIGVAHELYVLVLNAPKVPVMRISVLVEALNLSTESPLVDFLKPVTLPWLLLAFGSIRLRHFRETTDLSAKTHKGYWLCLGFIVTMAAGLVVAPLSCSHFMLPLELMGVLMEPLMLLALIMGTNRLHLHHRYVQLATYGFAALVVLHVPATIAYLSTVHPEHALQAHAWAHLATSIRHALVSFILPLVLFIGDLGVNQLQSEVETQSVRNQLQLRFFRWLMHEQRSPLNDISISLSLAQDSVQEIQDIVPAATATPGSKGATPMHKAQDSDGNTRSLVRSASASSDGILGADDADTSSPAELAHTLAKAALSYVDESFDGVKRLQRVMHQVRDFGALVLSHTGFEGSAMPFELHDMLTRTARRFELLAARKKQMLRWTPLRLDKSIADSEYSSVPTGEYANLDANGQPRPAVWVTADVVRLRSAIQNIVANAIKFTPKGKSIWVGSNVSLETAEAQRRRLQMGAAAVQDLTLRPLKQSCKMKNKTCAEAQKVVHCEVAEAVWGALSRDDSSAGEAAAAQGREEAMFALWTTIVEDDGRGIPQEVQSDMWNPFSTLVPHENGQNQGGSGLSLIIARAVVEKHGGSLHVFSEGAGEGTRVVMQVSVPVHKGRPAELADMGGAYSIEPEIQQWASGTGSGTDSSSGDASGDGHSSESGSQSAEGGTANSRPWSKSDTPTNKSTGGASGSNPRGSSSGSGTPLDDQDKGGSLQHRSSGFSKLHGEWSADDTGTIHDVADAELLTQLGLPAHESNEEGPAAGDGGSSSGASSPTAGERIAASRGAGSADLGDAEQQVHAFDESSDVPPPAAVAGGGTQSPDTAGGSLMRSDSGSSRGGEQDPQPASSGGGAALPAADSPPASAEVSVSTAPDGLPIIPEGSAAAHTPRQALPLRILCVDDAKTTRTLLKKLLKKRTKAEVIDVAENGQVAVDAVAARGVGYYSLILMDKEMPVMDGYEAARNIRKMGYRRTMLGVTGNALLADVAEFKRHGVCRVLTKPVDAAVLAKWAEFSTRYEHNTVHAAE